MVPKGTRKGQISTGMRCDNHIKRKHSRGSVKMTQNMNIIMVNV